METRIRWQGRGADIMFEPQDFDILDLTLGLIPELRLCALAVKRARNAQVQYPIEKADVVIGLLDDGQQFVGAGHQIKADDIRNYMPAEFFPIEHEGELVSRVYLALTRCKHEFAMARRVHRATFDKLDTLSSEEKGS